MNWHVVDTPCFPARYKVIRGTAIYRNNATSEFFRVRKRAQEEADRRNDRHWTCWVCKIANTSIVCRGCGRHGD